MSNYDDQAMKIFGEAVEIEDAAARENFVAGACNGDEQLRRKVDSIIADSQRADGFLDEPATDLISRTMKQLTIADGTQIGQYRILQEIGEGGFGVVYMAQQNRPVKRRVALKIVKPGMDSRAVIARFEAERQAVAIMDHPNIAKIFDAGTTDSGRPYFVMELVSGVPITQYCDENKLNSRQRLHLFTNVCDAVQHAHQKGVIHRDLKPSNILVTHSNGEPMAKVIDFGVAKAINRELTDKTLFTLHGQMIGTPQYMSPEQAAISATDLDTRSDIYSLGVLLYELLTGSPPLESNELHSSAYEEVQRLIREVEPEKPSDRLSSLGKRLSVVATNRNVEPLRLQRDVSGDLDWIVMKCLEKDRRRRYPTASDLEADVNRHLNGFAVEACPPSIGYRISKVVMRHRIAFVVGICFLAMLITSSVVAWTLFVAANTAKNDERVARQDATQAAKQANDALQEAEKQRSRAESSLVQLHEKAGELQRQLYIANIGQAANAFATDDYLTTRTFLDRCESAGPEEHRAWEWNFLSSLVESNRIVKIDGPPIHHMTPSPTADIVAVVDQLEGKDRLVLYELATPPKKPEQIWANELDISLPFKPTFSSDGSMIAIGSYVALPPESGKASLKVFDTQTGEQLFQKNMRELEVCTMAFAPDSNNLIYGRYRHQPPESAELVCQNIRENKELWRRECDGFPFISFARNGEHFYVNLAQKPAREFDTMMECRSLADGTRLWKQKRSFYSQVVPDMDNEHLLVGFPTGFELRNATAPETVVKTFGDGGFLHANFSPSGEQVLFVNDDNGISVRQSADYSEVHSWRAFSDDLSRSFGDAHWAWDGRSVMYTTGASNTIEFRKVATHEKLKFVGEHDRAASRYCYSPDGSRVYGLGGKESLVMWDAATGQELRRAKIGNCAFAITASPDGGYVAAGGDDGLVVLNARTFALALHVDAHVWHAEFSPDSKRIALGGMQRDVQVWDLQSKEMVAQHTGISNNGGLAFVDNEKLVCICDGKRQLIFWDLVSRKAETRGDNRTMKCRSLDSIKQQQLVAVGVNDTIEIWDARTKKMRRQLRGHRHLVSKVLFHPKDPRLFSIDERGGIRIWDTTTFEQVLELPPAEPTPLVGLDAWFDLCLNPDGDTLISRWGSSGHRVRETTKPSVDLDERRRSVRRATQLVNELATAVPVENVLLSLASDSKLDRKTRGLAIDIANARYSAGDN